MNGNIHLLKQNKSWTYNWNCVLYSYDNKSTSWHDHDLCCKEACLGERVTSRDGEHGGGLLASWGWPYTELKNKLMSPSMDLNQQRKIFLGRWTHSPDLIDTCKLTTPGRVSPALQEENPQHGLSLQEIHHRMEWRSVWKLENMYIVYILITWLLSLREPIILELIVLHGFLTQPGPVWGAVTREHTSIPSQICTISVLGVPLHL